MYRPSVIYALGVLFLINTMNFFDRQILGAVGELVKDEFKLSDTSLGFLGTAFILIYAVVGLPLGRLADTQSRTRVLGAGVFVWSILTATSGLATNFAQMFAMRLGVGIGEATCAPAATSLIGDLAPPNKRSQAFSIFMMGLPVGLALSFAVSGWIASEHGWRTAFYVAGIPGILCAILVLFVREPQRGASEVHDVGQQRRPGSPYWLVLSIPTMLWIILSGALHNFNMYAIGSFIAPYIMRYHELDVKYAGFYVMFIYGLSGVPGLILGGMLGDFIHKTHANGRLLVAAVSLLISAPCVYFALQRPAGDILTYSILMGLGCCMMYVYYATVYSTIHDVIEPALRGTAMALYFFAMYLLGASLGPVVMGYLSDTFTANATLAAGAVEHTPEMLKQFQAQGLRSALYIIPFFAFLLSLILFAGSMTVKKDMGKLTKWMKSASGGDASNAHDEAEVI